MFLGLGSSVFVGRDGINKFDFGVGGGPLKDIPDFTRGVISLQSS